MGILIYLIYWLVLHVSFEKFRNVSAFKGACLTEYIDTFSVIFPVYGRLEMIVFKTGNMERVEGTPIYTNEWVGRYY